MSRVLILNTHPIQNHSPLFRQLIRDGYDIEVLYTRKPLTGNQVQPGFGVPFEWDVDLTTGYPCQFLPTAESQSSGRPSCKSRSQAIEEILQCRRPRAVVIYGWNYADAWKMAVKCLRAGVPFIWRGDSQLNTGVPTYRRWMKYPVYRSFLNLAAGCFPVGVRSSDYFKAYGVPKERIHIVPHCVDDSRFIVPTDESRSRLRAKWGVPDGAKVFLFVGKLLPNKRPLDFLAAFQRASADRQDMYAMVVGDGPLRGECDAYISANKTAARMVGFVNQSTLPEIYCLGDILALTSMSETWGLVVNEALLAGTPCIVSENAGCVPELVTGKSGVAFQAGSVESLTNAMQLMSRIPASARAERALECRRVALQHSVEKAAERMIQGIDALAPC